MSLFADGTEFQKYVQVNRGFDIASFETYINNTFQKDIIKLVSQAQYDDSITKPNDAVHKQLIEYIKQATANLSAFKFINILRVEIDTTGITYSGTKERQASKEDKADVRTQLMQTAYEAIDLMLLHLEGNIGVFTHWAASLAFTQYNDCFVRNADEALFINSSRSMFLELKSYLKVTQNIVFKKALGTELFEDLMTHMKAKTLTDVKLELVEDYIRPCLSLLACAKAAAKRKADLQEYEGNKDRTPSLQDHVYKVLNNPAALQHDADEIYSAMINFIEENKTALGLSTEDEIEVEPFRNTPGSPNSYF